MAVQSPLSMRSWPSIAGFDWDEGNREKCAKHGVSSDEIEAALCGPFALFRDHAHSRAEERFKAIGRTDAGRYVLIVFTLRQRSKGALVRPISARYMHAKEIAYYEEEASRAAQR